MSMVYETIIGAVGAGLILVAFLLSSLNKLHRSSYRYIAINGSGATLLLYYGWVTNTIVFVVLNVIWLIVEVYYLTKKLMENRHVS